MQLARAFDGLAEQYDASFTRSSVGRTMRAATWRHMDRAFVPGQRVLELNCGTGEDAVHLALRGVRVLATDGAPGMVAKARSKVERAGLTGPVELAVLPIEDLARCPPWGRFDGVLSNFGGLNCVRNLPGVARALAPLVRPGGRALLCLMGPLVPWEWGWYLARGKPQKALRRLGRAGTEWRGLTVRYPSIRQVREAFAPHFEQRRVSAIGALVPPSFAEAWAARHPRLLATLDRLERRAEAIPPLPWLADHYLIELERTWGRGDV